jgi:hypothetical protein
MSRIHERISRLAQDPENERARAIAAAGRRRRKGDGELYIYVPVSETGALHKIRITAKDEGEVG